MLDLASMEVKKNPTPKFHSFSLGLSILFTESFFSEMMQQK